MKIEKISLDEVSTSETRNTSPCFKIPDIEKQELEIALARTQLKIVILELMIDVAEKFYGIDIKENCGGKEVHFL